MDLWVINIDGKTEYGEVVKYQLHGLTDIVFELNKKKVRFQYESRSHHQYAKCGEWTNGYLLTKNPQYCAIKKIVEK